MVFRRGLRPVNSIKNVTDASGILPATTKTILDILALATASPVLANVDEVETGSTINSIFLEIFFFSEGGEVANEVPLVDWYIIKNNAGASSTAELPTPGATGSNDLKRYILHEEKGLTGGGDASLSGVPMVFKGVIRLPRTFRRFGHNDRIQVVAQSNFNTKFCIKSVYKWYK